MCKVTLAQILTPCKCVKAYLQNLVGDNEPKKALQNTRHVKIKLLLWVPGNLLNE